MNDTQTVVWLNNGLFSQLTHSTSDVKGSPGGDIEVTQWLEDAIGPMLWAEAEKLGVDHDEIAQCEWCYEICEIVGNEIAYSVNAIGYWPEDWDVRDMILTQLAKWPRKAA